MGKFVHVLQQWTQPQSVFSAFFCDFIFPEGSFYSLIICGIWSLSEFFLLMCLKKDLLIFMNFACSTWSSSFTQVYGVFSFQILLFFYFLHFNMIPVLWTLLSNNSPFPCLLTGLASFLRTFMSSIDLFRASNTASVRSLQDACNFLRF